MCPPIWTALSETREFSIVMSGMFVMGGGAGPAGQVLAGPLFCLINYS